MVLLADLYQWMCLKCVRSAAILVVSSLPGCGGDDTSDVDVASFEVSPSSDVSEACGVDSLDPNDSGDCGC